MLEELLMRFTFKGSTVVSFTDVLFLFLFLALGAQSNHLYVQRRVCAENDRDCWLGHKGRIWRAL